MNLKKIVVDVCSFFSGDRIFVENNLTEKRLENAKINYKIPYNEEIYGIIDNTILFSCKYGLAFTNMGLYWKNDWTTKSNKTNITWNEFLDAVIDSYDKTNVEIGYGNLFNALHVSSYKASELLNSLQKTIIEELNKKNNIEEKNVEEISYDELPPLPTELKEWFLGYNQEKLGPYNINEIKSFLLEDKFDINNLLAWKKGMKGWENINNIKEISIILDDIPPSF